MVNIPDIPFAGRFPAKLEASALDDLGDRLPEGPGDALLIYDDTVPYLYLPNEDATDWLIFALIDITSGEPDDGHVAKWDATAHRVVFAAESGGGGGGVTYGKMTKYSDDVISSGSFEPVTWNYIPLNTANVFAYDAIAGDNIFTAPADGTYQHAVNIALYADASRIVTVRLLDQGGGILSQSIYQIGTTEVNISFCAMTELDELDEVRVYVSVNAGTVTVSGTIPYCEWSVIKLS